MISENQLFTANYQINGWNFAYFCALHNSMKLYQSGICSLLLVLGQSLTAKSQINLGNILKTISTTKATNTNNVPDASSLSTTDINSALKEALQIGISRGADQLSVKDGFLGNAAVKILFPPEAVKVETTLRKIGMGKLADQVITSLNRAAEDAAKEAKPIFVSAIKQMTIQDAGQILLGSQDAATTYFKRVTTAQLMEKFSPVIANSLNKVGATKYWTQAAGKYNKLPMVKQVDTDLSGYVAQKAIEGMFIQVAKEELDVRNNLGARTSPLLQKVFGYADKSK